jgi:hypothetical protein
VLVLFYRSLSASFDGTHLLRVVMIICERPIDVCDIYVMAVGDCPWVETSVLDLSFDELDGEASSFEMGFVVEFTDDPPCDLAH